MYNSKGPTSKTNFKPAKLSRGGFKKEVAPLSKNTKKDKLKPTKAK